MSWLVGRIPTIFGLMIAESETWKKIVGKPSV
jgi:hypothetical protein